MMNLLLMLGVMAILQIRPGQPPPPTDAGWGGLACMCPCVIVFLLAYIVPVIGACKVFAKAGQPAWAALVPIYNTYVLCQIVKKPDWFIMTLIPCINIYFGVLLAIELAKAFGKETGFGIGLLLLAPIFVCILGFGSAEYQYGGRKRRRQADEDEDEDEDDRPRRGRARDEEEEEEEEERPRRRPARDEDEDDEDDRRVKRRPRDDD